MKRLLFALSLATILGLAFLWSLQPPASVTAAPQAIVTPVSADRGRGATRMAVFFPNRSMTATVRSDCIESAGYDLMDLQYVIDNDTASNTATLTINMSNDLATFVNGSAVVTDVITDTTDIEQFQLFGRYTCLTLGVTTTDTVSIDARALFK